MNKLYSVCIDLNNNSGFYYGDRYNLFGKINKTLRNDATHINKGYTHCRVCGKKPHDRNDDRLIVYFWVCYICDNWNPLIGEGERGVFGCPKCGNEFDTN